MTASVNRERAQRLLRHYFNLVARAAGLLLDSDAYAELNGIVDCIVDAAKQEVAAETAAIPAVPAPQNME